jgi:hypothetical protein
MMLRAARSYGAVIRLLVLLLQLGILYLGRGVMSRFVARLRIEFRKIEDQAFLRQCDEEYNLALAGWDEYSKDRQDSDEG